MQNLIYLINTIGDYISARNLSDMNLENIRVLLEESGASEDQIQEFLSELNVPRDKGSQEQSSDDVDEISFLNEPNWRNRASIAARRISRNLS